MKPLKRFLQSDIGSMWTLILFAVLIAILSLL